MQPTGIACVEYFSESVQKQLVYAKACRSESRTREAMFLFSDKRDRGGGTLLLPTVHGRSHCRHYEFFARAHVEAFVRASPENLNSSKLCEAEWQCLCISGHVNIYLSKRSLYRANNRRM